MVFPATTVEAADEPEDEEEASPRRIRALPAGLPNGLPGAPGGIPGPLPIEPPDRDDDDPGDRGRADDEADEPPPSRSRSRSTRDQDSSARSVSTPGGSSRSSASDEERQKPPILDTTATVTIDFVDISLNDLVKFMADITGRNFILGDDLKGEITIISHRPVTVPEAYEAFLSALEISGFTTVSVGAATKIVATRAAANAPLSVHQGEAIPYTDNFVTQIFHLDNVSVADVQNVAKSVLSQSASIIAYTPTNTLIVTDAGVNIRRMWKIVSQLDVAAPRSRMAVIPIVHAQASEIQSIIEQLYGIESSEASRGSSSSKSDPTSRRKRRRRSSDDDEPVSATSTSVGKESKYISKIISDERTNTLIVMANETGMAAVMDIVNDLDVDVDPSSRAQIHVYYLEHASADEVTTVLSNLSEDGGSSSSSSNRSRVNNGRGGSSRGPTAPGRGGSDDAAGVEEGGSITAALADGVKITHDENTNSLVIVASPESYAILEQVIRKLDIRRKQVFVEAVIMEMASEDTMDMGVGYHFGTPTADENGLSYYSAQLNGSSLALSTDALSGLAMGVLGSDIEIASTDPLTGDATTLSIPAFGVALNALQANSSVNILSTPNVLTLDNEEAKIIVGRNIPFPISSGRDSNNNPIISYQREDVAITLQVTPQINESDYVTLEVFQEVTEIEEDSQGLDVTSAGFITSKRSAETTVLVKDNQTIVIGGLMGQTDTNVETKIPILGDLPLIGFLFRGKRDVSRKTNLLIFLTPHVIDDPGDLEEVYRVKVAQRNEFLRRFYGRTVEEQQAEMNTLLKYSMNIIDEPSSYRTKVHEAESRTTTISSISGAESPAPVESPAPADEPAATDEPAGLLDESN